MKDSRHIIWTDYLDYDDWKEDLEAQYPELSANERMNLMYEINGTYFQDEKTNLIFSFPVRFSLSGTWDFGTAAVWGTKKLKAAISAIAFIRNGTLTTPLGLWIKRRFPPRGDSSRRHKPLPLPRLQGRRFRNANRQSERKDIPRYGDPCGHYKNNPQARRRDCQSTRVSDPRQRRAAEQER